MDVRKTGMYETMDSNTIKKFLEAANDIQSGRAILRFRSIKDFDRAETLLKKIRENEQRMQTNDSALQEREQTVEELLSLFADPAKVYTDEELDSLQSTGMVNASYWTDLPNIHENTDLREIVEDVTAMDESLASIKKSVMREDAKTTKEILSAQDAISVTERLLDAPLEQFIQLTSSTEESISPADIQTAKNTMTDVTSALSVADSMDIRLYAAKETAEHPFHFMLYSMKSAINEYKEAKKTCIDADIRLHGMKENLIHFCEKAKEAPIGLAAAIYAPITDIVGVQIKEAYDNLCAIAKEAWEHLGMLAGKTRKLLNVCVEKLTRGMNMTMEAVTLGGWSVMFERNEARLSELFKSHASDYRNFTSSISPADYWNDIRQSVWGSEQSPYIKGEEMAGNIRQNILMGYARLDAFKDNIKESLAAVPNRIKLFAENGKLKIVNGLRILEADCLGMKAAVLEQLAEFYEKNERRVSAKITRLEQIDQRIWESMQNIQKEIHSLSAPTPWIRENYTPNPQLVQIVAQLEEMAPAKDIEYLRERTLRAIQYEKSQHEKTQNRMERAVLRAERKTEKKIGNLTADYAEAYGKKIDNLAKMEKSLEKLDKIAEKREKMENTSKDLTASAIHLRMSTLMELNEI